MKCNEVQSITTRDTYHPPPGGKALKGREGGRAHSTDCHLVVDVANALVPIGVGRTSCDNQGPLGESKCFLHCAANCRDLGRFCDFKIDINIEKLC